MNCWFYLYKYYILAFSSCSFNSSRFPRYIPAEILSRGKIGIVVFKNNKYSFLISKLVLWLCMCFSTAIERNIAMVHRGKFHLCFVIDYVHCTNRIFPVSGESIRRSINLFAIILYKKNNNEYSEQILFLKTLNRQIDHSIFLFVTKKSYILY